MVAVIHESSSIARTLRYNEEKVKAGVADCLLASGFLTAPELLGFTGKLRRFEKLTELNQRTVKNSLHVSLNFDPSEKLSDEQLKMIAAEYLERIGFGGQPYLVYRHRDAAHPHLHLVTTNIRSDGTAISMHKLAANQSKTARLAIEEKYGLVRAGSKQQDAVLMPEAVEAARVIYGKAETKKAIGKVLAYVFKSYKFASLAELNAVLGLYNVVADTGSADSRVRQHDGLVYRVLDAQGVKVGPPIKASLFPGKIKLKDLRQIFARHKVKPEDAKRRLRGLIDVALISGKVDRQALIVALKTEGVDVVLRQNADGVIYGITYVDHLKRAVFNGSELGKNYSAKAVLERYGKRVAGEGKKQGGQAQRTGMAERNGSSGSRNWDGNAWAGEGKNEAGKGLMEVLLDTNDQAEVMDWELKRKKRKKKRLRI